MTPGANASAGGGGGGDGGGNDTAVVRRKFKYMDDDDNNKNGTFGRGDDDSGDDDDDFELDEVQTSAGTAPQYNEYLLRVVPWPEWDKLFAANRGEEEGEEDDDDDDVDDDDEIYDDDGTNNERGTDAGAASTTTGRRTSRNSAEHNDEKKSDHESAARSRDFARREFALARFTSGPTTSSSVHGVPASAAFAGESDGPTGGPQYKVHGFARLCREGEETVRLRAEALREDAEREARLKKRALAMGRAQRRRDIVGDTQVSLRMRKKLVLEVEETVEEAVLDTTTAKIASTAKGSGSDKGASAGNKGNTSDDRRDLYTQQQQQQQQQQQNQSKLEAGEREPVRPSHMRNVPKRNVTKRRVYHGNMDSAFGSDYCIMIVRDDHAIDLVPVGRYAWYNFRFSQKLSEWANKRQERRANAAARQAHAAAAEPHHSSDGGDNDTEATVAPTATDRDAGDEDASWPSDTAMTAAAVAAAAENAGATLDDVERRMQARNRLHDAMVERRRNFFDARAGSGSGMAPATGASGVTATSGRTADAKAGSVPRLPVAAPSGTLTSASPRDRVRQNAPTTTGTAHSDRANPGSRRGAAFASTERPGGGAHGGVDGYGGPTNDTNKVGDDGDDGDDDGASTTTTTAAEAEEAFVFEQRLDDDEEGQADASDEDTGDTATGDDAAARAHHDANRGYFGRRARSPSESPPGSPTQSDSDDDGSASGSIGSGSRGGGDSGGGGGHAASRLTKQGREMQRLLDRERRAESQERREEEEEEEEEGEEKNKAEDAEEEGKNADHSAASQSSMRQQQQQGFDRKRMSCDNIDGEMGGDVPGDGNEKRARHGSVSSSSHPRFESGGGALTPSSFTGSLSSSTSPSSTAPPVTTQLPASMPDGVLPSDAHALVEEKHVRNALLALERMGARATVKEFLAYFAPWFPAQKARVGAFIRNLCNAREAPPGSGRVCVFLRNGYRPNA